MSTVISIEDVSKLYRLGEIGTGSLAHDVNRWWHKIRGNENPYLKVGESNDRSTKGDSDYVYAIEDVSFEVKQGEVLGVIGRNGAGKSTLLKILSRVTTPTSGQIKIKGRIASLLEVGTGFHPELTGRENIFLNGAILGMRKAEIRRKFDEIVDFSGCERYIDTPVKRYSSGMYVRLAFAVAAHLDSEILILDEVLAVGDAEFQNKCLGKMKDVAGHGRTVIFVSHNMGSVSTLCNNSIVLSKGRVALAGSTKKCIEYYHGGNSSGDSPLLETMKNLSRDVIVESLAINDQHTNKIFLSNDVRELKLKFKILLLSANSINIEAIVCDINGNRLGIFSPGHENGSTPIREPGTLTIEETILLPRRLNQGDYLLHIYVTHPNVCYHVEIENIKLQVESQPTITGKTFEYSGGAGWITLDSKFEN